MRFSIILIGLLSVALFFTACKKVDIAFGSEFVDNGTTQIIKTDTFNVDISTVYLDSFATSASNVGLIGTYTDPSFGKITAQSFLEIAPPTYSDIYANTSFDSIVLKGKCNSTFYGGDTTLPVNFSVFQLAEPIVPPNYYITGNQVLYNTDAFATQPTALGSSGPITLFPTRNTGDTFAIKMPNSLGQTFFKMLQTKSDTITNSTLFLQYFNGLCLRNNGSTRVFGISDSLKLRIYYKKQGLFLSNLYVDFTIGSNAHQFNNITVNRTGTLLAPLGPSQRELGSGSTNKQAYSQFISGTMMKLRFLSIRNMLTLPNYKKLLRATLLVRPVPGSYSAGIYPLPQQLRLSTTTAANQIGGDLTTTSSNGTAVTEYGDLSIDYLYGQNTYYTYDVTNFLLSLLADPTYPYQSGLLLTPPSPANTTTFNRVFVGDKNSGNDTKITLQLYYATVQ